METLQDTLEAWVDATMLQWEIQDAKEHHFGGEDYIFIFIGLVVLYIIVSAIIQKIRKK